MNSTLLKSALTGAVVAAAALGAMAQQNASRPGSLKTGLPSVLQRSVQNVADSLRTATQAEQQASQAGLPAPVKPLKHGSTKPFASPKRADSQETRIYFAVNPQDNDLHPAGAYWVDVNDPSFTYHRIGDQKPNATKGGVAVDDIYYATQVYSTPMRDWTVLWNLADTLSFTGTVYDGVYQLFANDAAYDPWTDRVVGICMSNYAQSKYKLGVIDYDKHSKQLFGPEYSYGKQLMSFAAGPECYWGIDYENNFYRIDKFSGETTLIGKTGVNANIIYGSSMIYEPKTKKIYYSPSDNNRNYLSSMFTIDPETGVATVLWEDNVRERRCGLWVDELTTADCPGLATDLAADFAIGSLSGKVSFTSPTTTWGGANGSGSLNYTILANGKQVAAGTTSYGTRQSVDVTIPGPGTYKFSIKTENAAGPSRWARLEAALGFEKPGKPAPHAAFADNKFTVNWNPVNLSAAGAAMDTAFIAYNVLRMPDSVRVAENLRDTVFVDNLTPPENLTTYYYGVSAVYGGVAEGEAGLSNALPMGHILAPWKEDFADHMNLDAFTVINANNDKYTWTFDSIYGHKYLNIQGYNDAGMNDWLITPPVKMEPGYLYRTNFNISNLLPSYNKPEQVRLLFGNAPTAEGMTTLIADTVNISSPDWVRIGDYVKVTEAGDYFFGLHATTPYSSFRLSLRDIEVEAPVSLQAPGYATDASIRSSYDDPSNVDISFITPTKRADGSPLQSISRLEVLRGDTLVVTYANPRVGTPIHCTDMVSQRGRNYIYSIVAYNEEGRGMELRIEDFIGIRKPSLPRNVTGWEKNGKVTMTWEAPATDELGNPLNPENVTYDVQYRAGAYNVIEVASDLNANTITFDYSIDDPNQPEFLTVEVIAKTEGGEGPAQTSYPIACGNAHSVPFIESFAGGRALHPVGALAMNGNIEWHLYGDNSFNDLKSYDNDGGMIGMQANQQGAKGLMSFAKIDLSSMNKPVLSFYVYNISGSSADNNEYEVLINDGTGFRSVYSAKVSDCSAPGWNKVSVPMDAAKGKTVQLALTATTQAYVYSLFDNFRLVEKLADNLSLRDFSAPVAVAANTEAAFNVTVENNGDNDANGYTLKLFRNSQLYKEMTVSSKLASGSSVKHTIPASFTTVDPDQAAFMLELSYEPDMDIDDNISDEKQVSVIKSSYPAPTQFHAEAMASGRDAELSWQAPLLEGAELDPVTESFETAAPWNVSEAADWKLVNRDGKKIGGANGITFPNGIQGSSTAGFFTFRYGEDAQFNQTWQPFAGNQMLISVYASDGSASDDWAISPELSGKAQTVSLRARSYDASYLESFRIMYSTTDREPASFVEAKAFNNISNEWTLYSANLPAGAKYMAINGVSQDKFMLFVDDITYVPGGDLQLKGYHVYRDGVRITEQPMTDLSYTDSRLNGGDYEYCVTAMYDRGESRPTDKQSVHLSGVDVLPTGVEISSVPGAIIVSGAHGMNVRVLAASGIFLYNGPGNDSLRIPAQKGVYMVTVAASTVKVMVK